MGCDEFVMIISPRRKGGTSLKNFSAAGLFMAIAIFAGIMLGRAEHRATERSERDVEKWKYRVTISHFILPPDRGSNIIRRATSNDNGSYQAVSLKM